MKAIPVMRPLLGPEEAAAAAEVVRCGWIAQGPRVAAFEASFALRIEAPHAVAVSSCTAGLHLALVVMGLGPGDDVVVPSFSFIATANVVRYVGARPVFADVDPLTGNLTPETIDAARTPSTRAVILVHQAGVPADRDAVLELCDSLGLALLVDAACAAGSTYRGAPVGSNDEIAAWSFHPRKLLTTGEGGMVTTRRGDWSERLRRLREHGMSVSASERHLSSQPVIEEYLETGFNYRMTDVQAAIGQVQLGRLDAIVARRRALAARYHELLADVPGMTAVQDPPYGTTNFQSYWVLLTDDFRMERNQLLDVLSAHGVSARRGIMAAHLEPAYAGVETVSLPVTERLTRRTLILPLFHELTPDEQERIVDLLRGAEAGNRSPVPHRGA